MKTLLPFMAPERFIEVTGTDKQSVLKEMAYALANPNIAQGPEEIFDELWERERLMSTGIGIGLAVPHARSLETETFTIAVGRSANGIRYDAVDGKPVKLFFAVVAPEGDRREYLKLLARIVMRLKDEAFFESLMAASTAKDMYDLVAKDGE